MSRHRLTTALLDLAGRIISGKKPEVVTPATAPVISDLLVDCYLWAAEKRGEPAVGVLGVINNVTEDPAKAVGNGRLIHLHRSQNTARAP